MLILGRRLGGLIFMLSYKDLSTLQNYCNTLTDPEIRIPLDHLIHEYRQYKQSGSPEDCAQ